MDSKPKAGFVQPAATQTTPLFSGDETEDFRSRWTDIQTGFVDEPRRVVEQFAQTALAIADYAAVMAHGQIMTIGQPQDIADELSAAYLGGAA